MKGFVGIGLISYSVYLWHQPLFVFARVKSVFEPSLYLMLFLAICSVGLGYLSWRFVEGPFRKKRFSADISRRSMFAFSISGLVIFFSFGVYGHITDGRITGFERNFTQQQEETFANIEEMRRTHREGRWSRFDNGDCVFDARILTDTVAQRISDCSDRYGSGTLILGDSHAIDLFGALLSNAKGDEFLVGLVSGGCRVHTAQVGCMYEATASFLALNPNAFGRIIYEQAGFYILQDDKGASASRKRLQVPLSDTVPFFVPNTDDIAKVVEYLAPMAEAADVVWLGPRLAPHIPPEYFLYSDCSADVVPRDGQQEMYQRLDAGISEALAGTKVNFVSQVQLLPFDLGVCGDLYWSDGDHFSKSGEEYFGTYLRQALLN